MQSILQSFLYKAFLFLQCFDTVDWVTRKTSSLWVMIVGKDRLHRSQDQCLEVHNVLLGLLCKFVIIVVCTQA